MSALHDVLRYLHSLVPARTQEEHDQIAALIDTDESGAEPAPPAKKDKEKAS